MAAELVAQGGEQSVSEVCFAARAEALEERGAEDGRGNGFVDGGLHGPAAFAGIGDAAGEIGEVWTLEQRRGGEIEQPGGDDAAAPPDFRDVGEIEVVLIVLRIAERRGFGVAPAWSCRRWRG